MKKSSSLSIALATVWAAVLWMGAPASSAVAADPFCPTATSCDSNSLNAGGSSAATGFVQEVPLSIFDQAPTLPNFYTNCPATGCTSLPKLSVWTGTISGTNSIVRYTATNSGNGLCTLEFQLGITCQSVTSGNVNVLDHTGAGCTARAGNPQTSPSGRQFNEFDGCTATLSELLHLAAADVRGGSFHQTGPITNTVTPIDDTNLTDNQVTAVPWSIVVENHVQKYSGSGTCPVLNSGSCSNVVGFSRTEVEQIFARGVTDWTQLGLVSVNADGTVNSTFGTAPISLCLRTAGSGSKAALSVAVLKDSKETPVGSTNLTLSAPGVYFGSGSSDVEDCIQGNASNGRPAHFGAAAYLDADIADPANTSETGVLSGGYPVKLAGLLAHDPSLADPKANVKCGMYLYWAFENFLYLPTLSSSNPNAFALATSFINSAGSSTVVANTPAGKYWVAKSDMLVNKNVDGGPVIWPGGKASSPECAQ